MPLHFSWMLTIAYSLLTSVSSGEVVVMKLYSGKMKRLLVVSNRGPITVREEKGRVVVSRSVSGLVSAVEPVLNLTGGVWLAWCGRNGDDENRCPSWNVPRKDLRYTVKEIILTDKEYQNFYMGFSNECLWPLSHSFVDRCVIDERYWNYYRQVNHKFATAVAEEWQEGDLVWIHDYHLVLVPSMLRESLPEAKTAFFWHIPFPAYDLFRILPWAESLVEGLLSCNLVAFHSQAYVENFLQCVVRLLGAEVTGKGVVRWKGKEVLVRAIPLGVDAAHFERLARNPRVQAWVAELRRGVGTRYLLLGVDRLDYTKGILERLQAIEKILESYPHYQGDLTFLQVAVPSRTEVKEYRKLKSEVEETVGRINGRFGLNWQVPVRYYFNSLYPEQLVALYLAADVMLVTPVRDGLNLVAKEFVASRVDEGGVLVLSPFCGAAEQLKEAVTANPYYLEDLVEKISSALEMPSGEAQRRMRLLRENVKNYDINYWWQRNLTSFPKAVGEPVFDGHLKDKGEASKCIK